MGPTFFEDTVAKAVLQCIDEMCGEPEPEPDYEALGYPETEVVYAYDIECSAELADTFLRTVVNGLRWYR